MFRIKSSRSLSSKLSIILEFVNRVSTISDFAVKVKFIKRAKSIETTLQDKHSSVAQMATIIDPMGCVLGAVPVKVMGDMEGPLATLPLDFEALYPDEAETAALIGDAWIWPSVIWLMGLMDTSACSSGASVPAGAVTVIVTVAGMQDGQVGQTDEPGTERSGRGVVPGSSLCNAVVSEIPLGFETVVGTSLGLGEVVKAVPGADVVSRIVFGVMLSSGTFCGLRGTTVSVGIEDIVDETVTKISLGV